MTSARWRVLCGEPENYSPAGLDAVRAFADLDAETLTQAAFTERAPGYDAVMVRLRLRVTAEMLTRTSSLRAVLTPTTGLNHIALEETRRRGVKVFHLRGQTAFLETVTSTAEHTWGLLLALLRRVPWAFEAVRDGRWEQRPFRGHELKGKTLGLVGCGRLGRIVAGYGHAFAMRVIVYDPYIDVLPEGVERAATPSALAGQSDVLSLHFPLNASTIGFIDRATLEHLPRGAVVVNTSRGEVVDEEALLDLLESGHLAGYAADVLGDEHLVAEASHPLVVYARTHENVLLTPHIGGAAWEAIEATDRFIIDRFRAWVHGEGDPAEATADDG